MEKACTLEMHTLGMFFKLAAKFVLIHCLRILNYSEFSKVKLNNVYVN